MTTSDPRSPEQGRSTFARSRALEGSLAQKTDASAALGVLYELASSPSTAPDALALLHELQVHQVEVDLQDEELRRSRVELETSLNRQVQLYDYAPIGFFTVDGNAVMRELNQTGASLLGFERDFLRGRSLDEFPDSGGHVDIARDARAYCRGWPHCICRSAPASTAGWGESLHARLGVP